MSVIDDKTYCFEGYVLDLRRGCLRYADEDVELRPKSFEVLRYFIEHAGRLVSKDELASSIWPRIAVADESVTRCVSDIRLALGDRGHRIIRTVARRGYIFEASVSHAPARAPSEGASPSEPRAAADGAEGAPGPVPSQSEGEAFRREMRGIRGELQPAERRHLTVMTCQFVGLAALLARLDLEDFYAILALHQRRCAELIESHHGHFAHPLDDGLVAYFGYPNADEHAAEHAVRCGLKLVEGAAQPDGGGDRSLQLRIGIASGIVVIGHPPIVDAARGQAIGETPIVAGRLSEVADAGSVVIAQSTRKLIGRLFKYRDLRPVVVEGSAEPLTGYHVLGLSAVESRFEARGRATLTPLVGREEELGLLQRRWHQACEGEGRVVLVSGEPGIGKSRLVAALEERLEAEPHTRLCYSCWPGHADSSLFPVIAQLERHAELMRTDSPSQRFAKLERAFAAFSAHPREDAALLADLLSLPVAGPCGLPEMSPQKRKETTFAALAGQLEGRARRQPVLVIFEDVHWLDPTTREFLEIVIERTPRLPVLLIVTFRPEFKAPWIGQPYVTPLALSRLGRHEEAALVGYVAGNRVLGEAMVGEIIARADGIPLFLEELTKAVLAADDGDDDGEAGSTLALSGRPIPHTLHALLIARLENLGPGAKEIAQAGSVIDREVPYGLLARVTRADDARLTAAFAALGDAGLALCRGAPPHATFRFKHALIQDAAYATLLRDQRRELHGRVVEALEQHCPDLVATRPEILARQCAAAGLSEKAVAYWLEASRQAVARCAMPEAISQAHKGLESLTLLPEGASRNEAELGFRLSLGYALRATKGYGADVTGETYARACRLCEMLNQPARLAEPLFGLWSYHYSRGDHRQIHELAAEMARLGDRNIPAAEWLEVEMTALNCLVSGRFASSREYCERCLEAYDIDNPPLGEDPGCVVGSFHAQALLALGYLDQARLVDEQIERRARQLGHPNTLALVLATRLVGHRVGAAASTMLERVESLLAMLAAQERYVSGLAAFAGVVRALCRAALGLERGGLAFVHLCLAMPEAASARAWEPAIRVWLADAHGALNAPHEGLKQIEEAKRVIEATEFRYMEAETHSIGGELLAQAGELAAAEKSFDRAIAVARRQEAKLHELRASVGLARLWRRRGDRRQALDLLAPIYGWFTEGFETPDLKGAKALLDALT
jgi:predicted ATPase/DNA-binding winged helix-turn-helix (wHTH) protein/class 3 adenylate cyclase